MNDKKPRIALISMFNLDLGIRYISSYLQSKGYSTDVIFFGQLRTTLEILCDNYISPAFLHLQARPDKDAELLLDLLFRLKPDLIGISLTSTSFITASFLTKQIKEKFNIPIVWGGVHPTLCPEDCIQYADIVCVGEGEHPLYELAQRLANNEEITAIKNLWIKRPDGSIEKNELRDLILELDSLPYPDFVALGNKFLIDRAKLIVDPAIISVCVKNAYPITSSRGCHYNCAFCCNTVLKAIYKNKGPYLRRRTPENVIDEIVYVRENREIVQINFWDDIFSYDQDWIERFCQLYIKKIALRFCCCVHPKYTDKKIFKMLAEAGLVSADIGIQSGSESFCKHRLKRDQSNEEIMEFANVLKKLNIVPRYNVILDNPYESDADFDSTAELMLRLPRPYKAELYSLCYFPRTAFTKQTLQDNLITEEDIEGRDNKALNNFYMFIDLAKDKKRLFWNTMIAMVVSNFFPERLIRRCKRSRFMRNHPRFILALVRLYLRISLLSPIAIFDFLLPRPILFKKNPRFFLTLVKLYLKLAGIWKDKSKLFLSFNSTLNACYKHVIDTPDYSWEDKNKVELRLLPPNTGKSMGKSICLKIRQQEPIQPALPLNLLLELHHSTLYSQQERLALWEINYKMCSKQAEIEIDLLFPHLFFKVDGLRQEATIKNIRKLSQNSQYIIYLLLYDESQRRYVLKNSITLYNVEQAARETLNIPL